MSGYYNSHVVIQDGPRKFKEQLASHQPPFFLGGSQVPEAFNFMTGSGITTQYRNTIIDGKIKPSNKVNQFPSTSISKKTVIPKKLFR